VCCKWGALVCFLTYGQFVYFVFYSVFIGGFGGGKGTVAPKTPEVALCPTELHFCSWKWCNPISPIYSILVQLMALSIQSTQSVPIARCACSMTSASSRPSDTELRIAVKSPVQKQRRTQNGPQNVSIYAIRDPKIKNKIREGGTVPSLDPSLNGETDTPASYPPTIVSTPTAPLLSIAPSVLNLHPSPKSKCWICPSVFWCIFACLFWVVSTTSASECLERLVSKMTYSYCVSRGT